MSFMIGKISKNIGVANKTRPAKTNNNPRITERITTINLTFFEIF